MAAPPEAELVARDLAAWERRTDDPAGQTKRAMAGAAKEALLALDERVVPAMVLGTAARGNRQHAAALLLRGRALALREIAENGAPQDDQPVETNTSRRPAPLDVRNLAESAPGLPFPETAAASLLAAAKLAPDQPATWLHLGHSLWRAGDVTNAGHCFARAASLNADADADSADVADALRSLAFLRRTQADSAQRSADAALDKARDDDERAAAKARAEPMLRDARRCAAEAIWLAKKAVTLAPRGFDGWAGLATSYLRASLLASGGATASSAKTADATTPPPPAGSLAFALRAYAQAETIAASSDDVPPYMRAEMLFNRCVARRLAEDFDGAYADAASAGKLDPTLPWSDVCDNLAASAMHIHAAVAKGKHSVPATKVARLAAAAASGFVPPGTAAAGIAELEAGARGALVVSVASHLDAPHGAPPTFLCVDAAGATVAVSLPFGGPAVGPGKVRVGSVLTLPTARVTYHTCPSASDAASKLEWRAVRVADPTDPANLLIDGGGPGDGSAWL